MGKMLTSSLNRHLRYVRVVKTNHVTLLAEISFFKTLKNYLTYFKVFCKTLKKKITTRKFLIVLKMKCRIKSFRSQNKVRITNTHQIKVAGRFVPSASLWGIASFKANTSSQISVWKYRKRKRLLRHDKTVLLISFYTEIVIQYKAVIHNGLNVVRTTFARKHCSVAFICMITHCHDEFHPKATCWKHLIPRLNIKYCSIAFESIAALRLRGTLYLKINSTTWKYSYSIAFKWKPKH